MPAKLRGLTWDHPRGVAGLRAASQLWEATTGYAVEWDTHSLQAFADADQRSLSLHYDLLVFDHPFIGAAAHSGFYRPLEQLLPPIALDALLTSAIGASQESYRWEGATYALAIDAASHVSARMPAVIAEQSLPASWPDALAFAKDLSARGYPIGLPLFPVDAINLLMTILAASGRPASIVDACFAQEDAFLAAADTLRRLAQLAGDRFLNVNPIELFDQMTGDNGPHDGSTPVWVPAAFGYAPYATPGFRPAAIAFGEPPGGVGILGGAGLAVSASSSAPTEAAAFAAFAASQPFQQQVLPHHWGQPANASAWDDALVNSRTGGFFSSTRAATERAWLRPRFDGFVALHTALGTAVHRWLRTRDSEAALLGELNHLCQFATPALQDRTHEGRK